MAAAGRLPPWMQNKKRESPSSTVVGSGLRRKESTMTGALVQKGIFCHYRVRVHSYLLVFLQARVSDALRSAISRVVVSVTLQV